MEIQPGTLFHCQHWTGRRTVEDGEKTIATTKGAGKISPTASRISGQGHRSTSMGDDRIGRGSCAVVYHFEEVTGEVRS